MLREDAFMKRIALGLLALVLLLVPVPTPAATFTDLFVLGDSLSDVGNLFSLTNGFAPPTPPYAPMRLSNGPVAAEYLAQNLGITLTPSTGGGTDFAVAGATTGVLNYNFTVDDPLGLQNFPALQFTGITAQVGAFLNTAPTYDPATTLFLVWGGPNDILLALDTGQDLATAVNQAVTNLVGIVAALAVEGGAQHVLVPNMVNLAGTPFALMELTPAEQQALLALVQGFNAGLAVAMHSLEDAFQGSGLDITVFDTFTAFERARLNPGDFGFTNVDTPCISVPADLLAGCPGYIFFDDFHPTTASHQILGNLFTGAVTSSVPAPPALLVLVAGLALAGYVRRRVAAARGDADLGGDIRTPASRRHGGR
jgi:phospholipase/lecithinase/hemolysin